MLFVSSLDNISLHLKNIFSSGELEENQVCAKIAQSEPKIVINETVTIGVEVEVSAFFLPDGVEDMRRFDSKMCNFVRRK